MSKAYLGKNVKSSVASYRDMLPSIGDKTRVADRGTKLGRTASSLEIAKAAARSEGFAQGLGEGRETGRAEGYQTAIAQEMEERQKLLDAFAIDLNQVAESVLTAVYDWFHGSEESLAALSMVIAARIVAREVTTTQDVALSIAREAVAEVTHAESARIRVNPFSSQTLAEHKDALMALSPSLKDIQIADDPSIMGGCVIESAGGIIDASLESRVAAILGGIRDHYAAESNREPEPKAKPARAAKRTPAEELEAA